MVKMWRALFQLTGNESSSSFIPSVISAHLNFLPDKVPKPGEHNCARPAMLPSAEGPGVDAPGKGFYKTTRRQRSFTQR